MMEIRRSDVQAANQMEAPEDEIVVSSYLGLASFQCIRLRSFLGETRKQIDGVRMCKLIANSKPMKLIASASFPLFTAGFIIHDPLVKYMFHVSVISSLALPKACMGVLAACYLNFLIYFGSV